MPLVKPLALRSHISALSPPGAIFQIQPVLLARIAGIGNIQIAGIVEDRIVRHPHPLLGIAVAIDRDLALGVMRWTQALRSSQA